MNLIRRDKYDIVVMSDGGRLCQLMGVPVEKRQHTIKRLIGTLLLLLTLLLLPATALAIETVPLNLDAVGGSGVSGGAVVTPAGEGTNVTLEIQGLPAGGEARAVMTAGTCAQPGASFATLPNLKADASGKATATGPILFRGTDPVALAAVADGQHVISIQTDKVVACGVIPHLAAVQSPSQLPTTGGAGFELFAVVIAALGFVILASGAILYQRNRS